MGYGHYSETSHGTYSQPPLSHEQHNLGGMHTSYDPYPGMGGAGSGAAGIGARGRSLRSGGLQDPYGALANAPEQYEMHETGRAWPQGNPRDGAGAQGYDPFQAAGLAGGDPYAVTRGASTNSGFPPNQSGINGLTRRRSQGPSTLPTSTSAESYPMPTPAPGYPGSKDSQYPPEKTRYSASYTPERVRYSASYVPGVGTLTVPPDEEEDSFGGYQGQRSAELDNPHSPILAGSRARSDEDEGLDEKQGNGPYPHEHEEIARTSFADDEDYGYNSGHSGQRVLRVRVVHSIIRIGD
jgi:hypothetical protein